MNAISKVALMGSLFLSSQLASAADFEGTVIGRSIVVPLAVAQELAGQDPAGPDAIFNIPVEKLIKLSGKKGVVVKDTHYDVRAGRARLPQNPDGKPSSYVLYDVQSRSFWTVRPNQENYVEFSRPDRLAAIDQNKMARTPAPVLELTPLGRSEKVNGFDTDGFALSTPMYQVRGWLSKDHPDLGRVAEGLEEAVEEQRQMFMPNYVGPRLPLTRAGLPIRTQTLSKQSYTVEEIVKLTSKKLKAADFELPAQFTKIDMRTEIRGMLGILGGDSAVPEGVKHGDHSAATAAPTPVTP